MMFAYEELPREQKKHMPGAQTEITHYKLHQA
jgi:hypothetical protein